MKLQVTSSHPALHNPLPAIRKESYSSSPCCMPPPCNQPPRCLQNMTGYYHYPYGYWFCGPYNVTIAPTPCEGPVRAGGSCGPICGPCPNFHGVCPCKTCSPCPPCGTCGPCVPCGLCGLCGLSPYPDAGSNMGYNQYNTNWPYTNSTYWNAPYQQSHPLHAYPLPNPFNAAYSGTTFSVSEPKPDCEHRCETDENSSSRGISIDPDFVKSHPFNKPTFKRSEPSTQRRPFSSDCSTSSRHYGFRESLS